MRLRRTGSTTRALDGRRCAGAKCDRERRAKLSWCEVCQEVPPEIQMRWLRSVGAIASQRVISDSVWDEYLEAGSEFVRARREP